MPDNSTGNVYCYTGRRIDAETGYYYYRARYYDPDMGRFLSADPIGYGDGLNMYAYVGNDPLNFTDPSGTSLVGGRVGVDDYTVAGFSFDVIAFIGFDDTGNFDLGLGASSKVGLGLDLSIRG